MYVAGTHYQRRGPVVDSLTSEDIAREIQIHTYLSFLGLSFLYYDHILTLQSEIAFIWRRSRTVSSWFFFVHRYTSFAANIAVVVLRSADLSAKGCKKYDLFRQVFLVIQQVLIGTLLTLRIHALYGGNKKILTTMLASGAGLLALAAWSLVGQHSERVPAGFGCHVASSKETGVHVSVAWIALFAFDTLLFFLTIARTYRAKLHQDFLRSSGGRGMPLVTLIVRDGSIYFAVMALANLCNIITFYVGGPLLRGCLSTFASCVGVTMMSRLMLNLHETAQSGILSSFQRTYSTFIAPVFEEEAREGEIPTAG